jgi:glycine cleavage system aminomethyltransferase T
VTSPTSSPAFGTIALGVVDTAGAAVGPVEYALRDGFAAAAQGAPAIYDPGKVRPRS